MASLADVNVMVALLYPGHEHFRIAQRWLDQQTEPGSVLICRVVEMGVLRTLTRPSIMGEEVRSPGEFWDGWEVAMQDERFAFVREPSGLEPAWKAICRGLPKGASGNTDTYLASFALAGGYNLVTFDGGFDRFSSLKVERLTR